MTSVRYELVYSLSPIFTILNESSWKMLVRNNNYGTTNRK
jgi:hypothetical protein